MMKTLKLLVLLVVVALVGIQFVPVERDNPPVSADFDESPEVEAILRRSCYDCHSNETRWPWYAHVAPVSWLVAHDVEEGRDHMNLSLWGDLDEKHRERLREEIYEEVEAGEMPLPMYLRAHGDAKLSREDVDVLRAWSGE
jgi:hypothetical protein